VEFDRTDQPEQSNLSGQDGAFERELRQAMERKPAPPSLKRRILQQRNTRRTETIHVRTIWWQRLAASVLIVGVIAGGFGWRQVEERRKGEEAKQQVLTALRITNRALNDMNRRLVEHNRPDQGNQ
jgi:hypothetical protein